MSFDRRTVVRGIAWTVPAVAVSHTAPAFAASGCAPVPFPTGWTIATVGSFKTTSGTQGYSASYASSANGAVPTDTINRFVSEQDSSLANNADPGTTATEASSANSSTITVSRVLAVVPGRAYTFSFSVASRFSSDTSASSQNQFLQIQTIAAGVTTNQLKLVKGSSNDTHFGNLAQGGWTQLPVLASTSPSANTGVRSQTYQFNYTPPAGVTSVTLSYLFTQPSRRRINNGGLYTGQADIAVSAPTITGEGC